MDDTLLENLNPEWDSLEIYFEAEKWDEFSAYEKERFLNLKKNYEVLKSIGLNPKVPQFMQKRKKAESKSSVKNCTVTVNSGSSKNDISEEQVLPIAAKDKSKEDSGESIPSSFESTSESSGVQRSNYYLSDEAREKMLRKMLPPQYANLKGKDLWQKLAELEWKPEEATVTPSTKHSFSLLFKRVQIYLGNLNSSKDDYLRSLGLHRKSQDEGKEEYGMFEDTTIKETFGVSNVKEKEEISGTLEGRDIKIDSVSENERFEVDIPLENEITEIDSPSEDGLEVDRSSEKENIEVDLISEKEYVEVNSSSENESNATDSTSENEDVEVDSTLGNENIEVDALSEEEHKESNIALENENEEVESVLEEEGSGVDGIPSAEEIEGVKSVSESEDNVDNIVVLEDKKNIDINCASEKEGNADNIAILEDRENNDFDGVSKKEAGADNIAVLQDEEDGSSTSEGEVAKDFSPRSYKKSPRYPKRKIAKVCYAEEDVSSDDELLFCDECNEGYEGDCPIHGPLMHVLDTPVPIGSCPDRAKRTCPAFMSVCRSGIKGAGLGVWTEWGIAKGVVFGPYEGKIVKTLKEAQQSGYAWEIRRRGRPSHYVEASDPSISNWLRFVNCAPCEQRQNLIAFQYNKQIFYRTYKLIPPAAELLVWYGDNFAVDLGICLSEDSDTGECQPEMTRHIKSLLKHRNRFIRCPKLLQPGGNISTNAVHFTVEADQQQKPDSRTKMRNKHFSKTKSSSQCEEPGTSMEGRNACIDKKGTDDEPKKDDFEIHCSTKADVVLHDKLKTQKRSSRCNFSKKCLGGVEGLSNPVREEKSMHKCSHCNYKTLNTGSLKRHVNAVHMGLKPHKCPHCDYRASEATRLKEHVSAVHMGLKPHKCSQCDYRASQAIDLNRHVNAVHMGLKPHKCPHCDYRASEAKILNRHVSAVHIGFKSHKCPHCDYMSAWSDSLRRHLKSKHKKLNS